MPRPQKRVAKRVFIRPARKVWYLGGVIREEYNAGATTVKYKILRDRIIVTAEYPDKIHISHIEKSRRFPILDSSSNHPLTYPPLIAAFLRLDGEEYHQKFYQKYSHLRVYKRIDLTRIQRGN